MDGFQFVLKEYCAYCADFVPVLEQYDCTMIGDAKPMIMNKISCGNTEKCAGINKRDQED